MSHTNMEPNTSRANAKAPRAEKVEDTVEVLDDPEKTISYRISEAEISQEQEREEARIMSVTNFIYTDGLPLTQITRRKVDLRLIPILGALYSIAGLDRVNLSNARAAGMNTDLGFNIGERYTIALLVFFITYFLFEMPSTLSLRYVGPNLQLNAFALSWGVIMLGMGWANDWRVIVVCRALVGVFEAGFLPSCMLLLSCWYQRYEVQKRYVSCLALFNQRETNMIREGWHIGTSST